MTLVELDIKHRLATRARTFEEFCKVIELLDAQAAIFYATKTDKEWRSRNRKGTLAECILYVQQDKPTPGCRHAISLRDGRLVRVWGDT